MSKLKTTVEHGQKSFYCEWNPRLANVISRMEKKGDNNRILKMILTGTGKFETNKLKLGKSIFFRNSFSRYKNPIRFKETIIDFRKNSMNEPIPIEIVRDEFDFAMDEFPETTKTIIVDEIIWVDNHDNKNWNNLGKVRWMGLMDRKEVILKANYRSVIPDLVESGVYRPLVMAKADRFDMYRNNMNHIKRKKMRSAELAKFDPFDFFRHLWVDSGDIEAFIVDPKTRIAETIPIRARWNGHIHQFQE